MRGSWPRLLELVYLPTVQMILWGLITQFLVTESVWVQQAGGALMDMMRHLNEDKGITFVFSTHDPMVVERARRVIRLRDGEIESDERKPA